MDSSLALQAADAEVDRLRRTLDDWWTGLADATPRLAAGLVIVVVAVILGRLARWLTRRALLARSRAPSFVTVMSKVAGWAIVTVGALMAAAVVFPSVKPVDLLAGAGLFSIAIGFAFRDIFENLLAGILLLFRQPFASGDQVEVEGAAGVVAGITIRETRIRTFDGQLKIVPNSDVYKNVIRVQTAQPHRRLEFTVGIAYEDDLDVARSTIRSALADLPEVQPHPAPAALVAELAASTVDISVFFWTDSRQTPAAQALDRSIAAVKEALEDAGVQLPNDIVTIAATRSLRAAIRDDDVELTESGSLIPK